MRITQSTRKAIQHLVPGTKAYTIHESNSHSLSVSLPDGTTKKLAKGGLYELHDMAMTMAKAEGGLVAVYGGNRPDANFTSVPIDHPDVLELADEFSRQYEEKLQARIAATAKG